MENRIQTLFIAGIVLAVLTGTSAAMRPAPDWVDGRIREYPKSEFITAIGTGKTPGDAAAAARGQIEKGLRDRLAQYRKRNATRSFFFIKRKTASPGDAELAVVDSSSTIFVHIEIADTWRNSQEGISYALAILDRTRMHRVLSERITELEDDVQTGLFSAAKSTFPIEKIHILSRVLAAWDTKEKLVAQRAAIGLISTPPMNFSSVRDAMARQKEEELKRVVFTIVDESPGTTLYDVLSAQVRASGFTVLPPGKKDTATNTACCVLARFQPEPPQRGTGKKIKGSTGEEFIYSWKLSIQLRVGGPDGKILATSSPEGQGLAPSLRVAQFRARTMARQTAKYVLKKLINRVVSAER